MFKNVTRLFVAQDSKIVEVQQSKESTMKFDYSDLNFNSRETYLEWRANWRAEYKKVSEDIRKTKNDFKNEQRKVVIDTVNNGYGNYRVAKFADHALHYKLLSQLMMLRSRAFNMLKSLGEAHEKCAASRAEHVKVLLTTQ